MFRNATACFCLIFLLQFLPHACVRFGFFQPVLRKRVQELVHGGEIRHQQKPRGRARILPGHRNSDERNIYCYQNCEKIMCDVSMPDWLVARLHDVTSFRFLNTATGRERLIRTRLIRSYYEIFFYHFPNIPCLKCTVNSNFHLIRSKTLPTKDFELTVPDLYIALEPVHSFP